MSGGLLEVSYRLVVFLVLPPSRAGARLLCQRHKHFLPAILPPCTGTLLPLPIWYLSLWSLSWYACRGHRLRQVGNVFFSKVTPSLPTNLCQLILSIWRVFRFIQRHRAKAHCASVVSRSAQGSVERVFTAFLPYAACSSHKAVFRLPACLRIRSHFLRAFGAVGIDELLDSGGVWVQCYSGALVFRWYLGLWTFLWLWRLQVSSRVVVANVQGVGGDADVLHPSGPDLINDVPVVLQDKLPVSRP